MYVFKFLSVFLYAHDSKTTGQNFMKLDTVITFTLSNKMKGFFWDTV